jgi:DNA replication and checkpoint protein
MMVLESPRSSSSSNSNNNTNSPQATVAANDVSSLSRRKQKHGTSSNSWNGASNGGMSSGDDTSSVGSSGNDSSTTASTAGSSSTTLSVSTNASTSAPLPSSSTGHVGNHIATAPTARNSTHSKTGAAAAASASSLPKSSCPAGRWALLCAQNALRMGARTQLSLCPPGKNRRALQAALRQRTASKQEQLHNMSPIVTHTSNNTSAAQSNASTSNMRRNASPTTTTGKSSALLDSQQIVPFIGLESLVGKDRLEEYEVQEEDYLINTNTFEVDSDEEGSSGDEDQLLQVDSMFSDEPFNLDDDEPYSFSEPLYTPASTGMESAATPAAGGAIHGSKLPFNRRKMRFFDMITADESRTTRRYLQTAVRRSKQQAALAKCREVQQQRIQQRQSQSSSEPQRNNAARTTASNLTKDGATFDEAIDASTSITPFQPYGSLTDSMLFVDSVDGRNNAVPVFEHTMTPALAASLLLESLTVHRQESLEGMAACYEGIVAAGVAVLDTPDPTQPVQTRPSRSAIMAALAPLLITTLEPASGEVILLLAKLRRLCATSRYRRRFVQRIAPALIRPPNGAAMWCLRHQNDMVAILAATELLLDAAFDVFSKGWYERGRWMLADSKRAETLSAAAKQLRNLSQEPDDGLLSFVQNPQHRRRLKHQHTLDHHHHHGHDEPLAEWEVIAVDRQIRVSIGNVLQTDWTRASAIHEASIPRPIRLRSASTGSRRVSESSSRAGTPKSPRGAGNTAFGGKAISSSMATAAASAAASLSPMGSVGNSTSEFSNFYDPSFGPPFHVERMQSPPPPSSYAEQETSPNQQLGIMPPPKSPKSPNRINAELSPKRMVKDPSGSIMTSGGAITPLSPSASSIGSAEMIAYKPSSAGGPSATLAASSGPTAHYRMLTSTTAERKRTVAACRALRAQIQRFEDAFVQVHGRPPKGAGERAPLATTYAQYREWKRAIRADAACRIQALFRGASGRWALLRMNNALVTRVILNRAGRPGTVPESLLNRISLPTEIGQPDAAGSDFFRPAALSPQWSKQTARPPTTTAASSEGSSLAPSVPRPQAGSPSTSPTDDADPSTMTFAELQTHKRELKQQLKQFDMSFAAQHGRMPVKSEKEPIRHLYESYNRLKTLIVEMERDGRHVSPSPASASNPPPAQQSAAQRTTSPSSNNSSSDESTSLSASRLLPSSRASRKLPKPSGGSSSSTSSGAAPSLPTNDSELAALRSEKQTLHTMLRSFEKDFFRENQRQVSSFADIRPVASQYRRYKEIKRAIAALQSDRL